MRRSRFQAASTAQAGSNKRSPATLAMSHQLLLQKGFFGGKSGDRWHVLSRLEPGWPVVFEGSEDEAFLWAQTQPDNPILLERDTTLLLRAEVAERVLAIAASAARSVRLRKCQKQ